MAQFFISHSSKDAQYANSICDYLENNGYSCWIAPRNIRLGFNWDEELIDAIDSSTATILVLSSNSNNSFPVKCEVERTLSRNKSILPVRIENILPSRMLEFYLSVVHWIDLFPKANEDYSSIGDKLGMLLSSVTDFTNSKSVSINLEESSTLSLLSPANDNNKNNIICATDRHHNSNKKVSAEYYHALSQLKLPSLIYNRKESYKNAVQEIKNGAFPFLLIQGLPGMGKTVLIGEIVRDLGAEYDHIITVKFEGAATCDPYYTFQAINDFLHTIGKGFDESIFQTQPHAQTVASIATQLFPLKLLIVLDGMECAPIQNIEPLLNSLESSTSLKVLISSRENVFSRLRAHILVLPPLNDEEAYEFSASYIQAAKLGIKLDDIFHQLPESVKRNPGVLKTLLNNIDDVPISLLLKSGLPDDLTAWNLIINKALVSMDNNTHEIITWLYLINGTDLESAINFLNISIPKDFPGILKKLLAKSLVYRKNRTYDIPQIVFDVLYECAHETVESCISRIINSLENILIISDQKADDIGPTIDMACAVILRLYYLKKYTPIVRLISEDFLEYLNMTGNWKEYWLLLGIVQKAALECSETELFINLTFRIARKSLQMKDAEAGRNALIEVEKYVDKESMTKHNADLLSHKSLFSELDGNKSKALQELKQSYKIHKSLNNQEGYSLVGKLIGNIYLRKTLYSDARKYYKSALSFFEQDCKYMKQSIEVESSIALCDLLEDNLDEALPMLLNAERKCKDNNYQAGLPRIYATLGQLYEMKGNLTEADAYAQKALDIGEKTDRDIILLIALLRQRIKKQLEKGRKG